METVLITGASSGIGKEFARIFAAHHYTLILTARNEERLREIRDELGRSYQEISIEIIPMDLAKPGMPRQLFEEIHKRHQIVNVLINNAGFGLEGPFSESNWPQTDEMIRLNILALTGLIRLVLGPMLANGKGRILNVASTAAFLPGPYMAVYYASKAYVLSLSRALTHELKDKNIIVSALCPGPTKTGFQERAGIGDSGLFSGRFLPVNTAADVARAGFKGLMKGKTVIIPGFLNKAGAWSSRILPSSLSNRFVENLHNPG